MSLAETTVARREVEAALEESQAIATLHVLNASYLRAFAESDVNWYSEHLGDDFVCTLADGRRVDKSEFLQRTRAHCRPGDISYDEIDVHLLGDVALVHGVVHSLRSGTLTRFTTVWQLREACWLTVAAQLTDVLTRSRS